MPTRAERARMPPAVHVLGLAVFALGSSEFMLSGLLPSIARDMDVTIPQAGMLISAFAIGMVVGAPLLAVATLRLPRRTTLIALLAVFGLGQVAGALAPNYEVLFVSRVVSALACAGFWAVGAAVAVAMVPATARARALAVMIGGLSIANILGVPAGAFLGTNFGWRSAFWAVGAASAVALAGVVALVPRTADSRTADDGARPRLRQEMRIYRDRMVWLAVVTTALVGGGVFCTFSYLAPLLTDVAGLTDQWVPTVLALFGVGALIGTTLGGRFADAHLFGVMLGGVVASTLLLTLMALTARHPAAVVTLSFLVGISAFFAAPALNARMFNVAGAAPTLAAATTTAAFNLGNAGGPWVGGTVIDLGFGFASAAWAGAAISAAGIAATLVSMRLHRGGASRRVAGRTAAKSSVPAEPFSGASGGATRRR